jgi:hypothetical protein
MPDILDYTLPQLRGFLAAIELREAQADARLPSLIVIGTRSEPKHLERTLDRLTSETRRR